MESKGPFFKFRCGRLLSFLAVIIVVVFLAGGSLLATDYKHLGNLLKVVTLVRTQYLQPVDTTQLVDGAIRGIVGSLNDPYSVYLDPKTYAQLNEQIKGSFGGLGILVGVKEDYLTVVKAYQGTPAAKAGIIAGGMLSKLADGNISNSRIGQHMTLYCRDTDFLPGKLSGKLRRFGCIFPVNSEGNF